MAWAGRLTILGDSAAKAGASCTAQELVVLDT
jgi:hypothetical protein